MKPIKESYLLLLIVLGLVSLGIYTTYAMFTSSVEIGDISLDTTLQYTFKINSNEQFTIGSNSRIRFNAIVENDMSDTISYGVYYKMINPSTKEDNLIISEVTDSDTLKTSGPIESGLDKKITIPLVIINNTSSEVTVEIGVRTGFYNDNNKPENIIYQTGEYLIDTKIATSEVSNETCEATGSGDCTEECYTKKENGYKNTYCTTSCTKLSNSELINNLDKSGANTPDLVDGLIPVVYYDNKWVKADSDNSDETYQWYDYNNKLWANAVLVKDSENKGISDLSNSNNIGIIYGASVDSNGINISSDSSTYIELPNNIGVAFPATYSVTFSTNSTENQVIFGDYNTQASLGLYNSNKEFIVVLGSSGYSSQTYKFNTGGISINTTYTVDLVYHSLTNVDVYLNGNQLSKNTSTDYWAWDSKKSYIGKRPSGTSNFNGVIKKFIVYNDELTLSEINHNYNVNSSEICNNGIICDNLKLYYNFNTSNLINNSRTMYQNVKVGTEITESDILAFYVWIPRYKYKVWNKNKVVGTDSYNARTTGIDIVFENERNKTGTVSCTYGYNSPSSSANSPNETCTGSNEDYYTHPAFTFGNDELKGFWIGKYEISSSNPVTGSSYGGGNTTGLTVRILPNVTSWRNNTTSNFNTVIQNMQTSSNVYGLSTSRTNTDSHMITNMEWGAVAYLTNSKYGRCTNGKCSEVSINGYGEKSNYTTRTGCGPISSGSTSYSTTCNAYNTTLGQLASTTGNVTGVYDMSGGAWEYTMGNVSSASGSYTFYPSYSGFASSWYTASTAKYLTTYAKGSSYNDQTAYNRGRLGDATGEIVLSTGDSGGWYSDYTYFPNSSYSWFVRGGYFAFDVYAGVLCFYINGTGFDSLSGSSRAILVSLK